MNRKYCVLHFSSLWAELFLIDEDMQIPLVHLRTLVVNVNPETRHPEPLLNCIKKKFSTDNCEVPDVKWKKSASKCTELYEKPEIAVSYFCPSRISAIFIDGNDHTNAVRYADLCYYCLGGASGRRVFKSTESSIFEYKIHRVSLLYLNESKTGDIVGTVVWQNNEETLEFSFHI